MFMPQLENFVDIISFLKPTMVHYCSAATPAGVIAYNGENPRGWNDPPTFAFSNKGDRGKPKLDLRKRVSHQQALSGTPSAMTVPNRTQNLPAYTASSVETSGKVKTMAISCEK